ncbi:MAG TPA: periplasmic heavy metal sensor [Aestuariivirgaceae bacterium]|nr:periplasmic heavy metal sensor [Aestuariivirgaceae bacterium]
MTAPDSGPPASTSSRSNRRWLVPLVVASLAVNLVFVGAALSGRFWPHHGERGGLHRSADLMPRAFFAGLDRQRRDELVEVFRARRPAFREERRALREAAAALADALEREPYDEQPAQSAIAEHTAKSHQLIDLGAAVAADLVEVLAAEERRALAAAIRQRLEEDRLRHGRRERRSP